MIKYLTNLTIIGCFLLGLSVISCGQKKAIEPKIADEFEKIYKEFNEAGKKRDISVIEKYLDDNYEMQNGEKTYTRDEIIKGVKDNFARTEEVIESSYKIENIEFKDGNYYLDVLAVTIFTYKLPGGKTARVETKSESTDIWKKTDNGWKEIKQIVRKLQTFVDGKEIPSN